jgi:hypothetical protein
MPASAIRLRVAHPEYGYESHECPSDVLHSPAGVDDEAAFVSWMLDVGKTRVGQDLTTVRLMVDITGFMRAELVHLFQVLRSVGVTSLDCVYAEPAMYRRKAWTGFSKGVKQVRQVRGCEGTHELSHTKSVLVIGAGYDDTLMSAVAESKAGARKVMLFGLPSLAMDMYQEGVWRVNKAAESIGAPVLSRSFDTLFAPANDPFVTADVVHDFATHVLDGSTSLYLCPLGTKTQVLGFALCYAKLGNLAPASVLLPFPHQYERETGTGLGRIWEYEVRL